MTKHLVWSPPQYGNAGGWRECSVDRFGVWRSQTGMYMPAPKPDRVKEELKTIKSLSIRQPWATLILMGKDIENRSWHTKFRGRFLIHASKGMTKAEYAEGYSYAIKCGITDLPRYDEMLRGGFIGSVELVDSLDHSDSPWYMGQKGFLLRDPQHLPFIPYVGQLQFFDVPMANIERYRHFPSALKTEFAND